jgi:predicted DNA-binding transcriptional regulator YafY
MFERDKRALRDEGIDVEVSGEGDEAGYRIDPGRYYLPDLGLTDDEVRALNVAMAAVRLNTDAGTGAASKLGAPLLDAPPLLTLAFQPGVPVLMDASRAAATVRFRYGGVDREVEPWGVLTRDGYWYVTGLDRTRGERRTFRVDRVEGEVAVGEPGSYTVPDDFDVRTALPDEPWRLGGETVYEVDVVVDAVGAARLGDVEVRERRPDGAAVVRLDVTNLAGFRSWLFGLLGHARVVSPPEVVDDVTTWLRAMTG